MSKAYAAARWAAAVVKLLDAPDDPTTGPAWAHAIGVGAGTLRNTCRTARLSGKRSLDLARLLRALYQSRARPWVPEQWLDVIDQRTLHLLLTRGGLNGLGNPTIEGFLQGQTLVTNIYARDELQKALAARGLLP